jgi:hypothetical protein
MRALKDETEFESLLADDPGLLSIMTSVVVPSLVRLYVRQSTSS